MNMKISAAFCLLLLLLAGCASAPAPTVEEPAGIGDPNTYSGKPAWVHVDDLERMLSGSGQIETTAGSVILQGGTWLLEGENIQIFSPINLKDATLRIQDSRIEGLLSVTYEGGSSLIIERSTLHTLLLWKGRDASPLALGFISSTLGTASNGIVSQGPARITYDGLLVTGYGSLLLPDSSAKLRVEGNDIEWVLMVLESGQVYPEVEAEADLVHLMASGARYSGIHPDGPPVVPAPTLKVNATRVNLTVNLGRASNEFHCCGASLGRVGLHPEQVQWWRGVEVLGLEGWFEIDAWQAGEAPRLDLSRTSWLGAVALVPPGMGCQAATEKRAMGEGDWLSVFLHDGDSPVPIRTNVTMTATTASGDHVIADIRDRSFSDGLVLPHLSAICEEDGGEAVRVETTRVFAERADRFACADVEPGTASVNLTFLPKNDVLEEHACIVSQSLPPM